MLQGEWPVVEFSSHCWTWMTPNLELATLRAAERMGVSVPSRDPTVCQTVYTAYPEWKSSSLASDLLPCSCRLSCWVEPPKPPALSGPFSCPLVPLRGLTAKSNIGTITCQPGDLGTWLLWAPVPPSVMGNDPRTAGLQVLICDM